MSTRQQITGEASAPHQNIFILGTAPVLCDVGFELIFEYLWKVIHAGIQYTAMVLPSLLNRSITEATR